MFLDSWTILIIIAVATTVFLWNYSFIPSTKTEIPSIEIGLSPLSVQTRGCKCLCTVCTVILSVRGVGLGTATALCTFIGSHNIFALPLAVRVRNGIAFRFATIIRVFEPALSILTNKRLGF